MSTSQKQNNKLNKRKMEGKCNKDKDLSYSNIKQAAKPKAGSLNKFI